MTPTEEESEKRETTTVRMYADHARDLWHLASLRQSNVAEVYRDLCDAAVKAALRGELKKRLAETEA